MDRERIGSMNLQLFPSSPTGTVKAIASKSVAHRLLICAAFATGDTRIRCEEINEDICATAACLRTLGASVEYQNGEFLVRPIDSLPQNAILPCGESGSTLRFLLPVVSILGVNASFELKGRLAMRPLSPLREELERCGITLSPQGSNPLLCQGKLTDTHFTIAGNVSSQFISGLLFALALSKTGGTLTVQGHLESASYVAITAEALSLFGIEVITTKTGYEILPHQGLQSPSAVVTEGDWSGAAFPLCMGAVGKNPITVTGLSRSSLQGDREILSLLRRFGASIREEADSVTVSPAPLRGIEIDAAQIPDLIPVVATVASIAEGRTVIRGAARLRLKESDRLESVRALITDLGGNAYVTEDGLIINGASALRGGCVSSFGDHRIAMSAAVASLVCADSVTVKDAHVTAKSYPSFWEDMKKIGLSLEALS